MERLGFIYLCEGIHPQTKCFWKLSKTSFLVIKGVDTSNEMDKLREDKKDY